MIGISAAIVSAASQVPIYLWIPIGVIVAYLLMQIAHLVLTFVERWEERRKSPLEIIFDLTNPLDHFWSQGSVFNEDKTKAMIFMEYRIMILNTSSKTIRNVRVTRRHDGMMPILPQEGTLKLDGSTVRDLQPKCYDLVPVCYVGKPQAGDAWGDTATQLHSPITIIASGDDISPAEHRFSYHPDTVPAIVTISKR